MDLDIWLTIDRSYPLSSFTAKCPHLPLALINITTNTDARARTRTQNKQHKPTLTVVSTAADTVVDVFIVLTVFTQRYTVVY